jgi:hypothetical protein
MRLAISEYSHLVKILTRPKSVGPTGGEVFGTPTETAQRWAHAVPQASRRWQQLQTAYVELRAAFVLRQATDVKVGDMVEHAGKRFVVIAIETAAGLPAAQSSDVTVICNAYE